jgi:hypothetical protein
MGISAGAFTVDDMTLLRDAFRERPYRLECNPVREMLLQPFKADHQIVLRCSSTHC